MFSMPVSSSVKPFDICGNPRLLYQDPDKAEIIPGPPYVNVSLVGECWRDLMGSSVIELIDSQTIAKQIMS